MDKSEISTKLIQAHKGVQRDGGYDDADTVADSTCPLTDLKGFDSMLIPQLIRKVARDLGHPFKKGERVRKNVYVDGRRKLSISEIAVRLQALLAKNTKEVAA